MTSLRKSFTRRDEWVVGPIERAEFRVVRAVDTRLLQRPLAVKKPFCVFAADAERHAPVPSTQAYNPPHIAAPLRHPSRTVRNHRSNRRRRDGRGLSCPDTKLNRSVAIKVLPRAVASDADRLARFRREAQVLASLNHPNIAAIYGLEESDGSPSRWSLEFVEGEDLAERSTRGAAADR